MIEHRGRHKKVIFKTNREKVLKWLKENPDKSMKQCSKDTGLSYQTARCHIKSILGDVVE